MLKYSTVIRICDARLQQTRLTRKELIEKIDKDVQKSIDAFRMVLDRPPNKTVTKYLRLCLKEYLWLMVYIPLMILTLSCVRK